MKVVHRRYPDINWEFRAVCQIVINAGRKMDVVFGKSKSLESDDRVSIEIYSGPNYIPGERGRSHSRVYTMDNYPKKYDELIKQLTTAHNEIKWDSDIYLNKN